MTDDSRPAHDEGLTWAEVETVLLERNRLILDFAAEHLVSPQGEVYCQGHKDEAGEPTLVAHTPDMLRLAAVAADLYKRQGEKRDLELAIRVANCAITYYQTGGGAFDQRFAYPWVGDDVFRTAPWGTAFHGNALLRTWRLLRDEIPGRERLRWENALRKVGGWIHRNPILGTVVLNCAVDLAGLLWLLGEAFDRAEWKEWALETLRERFRRELSAEGLNMGEAGGFSGQYHVFATKMLAEFAFESGLEEVREIVAKMWDCARRYTAPDLTAMLNLGTRSGGLKPVYIEPALLLAAHGDGEARRLAERFFARHLQDPAPQPAPNVFHNRGSVETILASQCILPLLEFAVPPAMEMWQRALTASPPSSGDEPIEPVYRLPSAELTILQNAQWKLWFSAYEKNCWCRGFCALWNATRQNYVFATLSSLGGGKIETKRHKIGEPDLWAGLPYVRVRAEGRDFFNQRRITRLATRVEIGEPLLEWEEVLVDDEENPQGKAEYYLKLGDPWLELTVHIGEIEGETHLQFHTMSEPMAHNALWTGEEVTKIEEGQLPQHGGMWTDEEFSLDGADSWKAAIQDDNSLVIFDFLELAGIDAAAFHRKQFAGLHAGNNGGSRLQLTGTAPVTAKLRVRCL